jgi:hypothetical protein
MAVAVVLEQLVMAATVVLMRLVGILLMLLVGRVLEMVDNKAQVLHMPSLLVVKLVMTLCLMMKVICLLLERGKRSVHLMYGSTLPRKGWSLRTIGRHMFSCGHNASGQDASTRADVRVTMEQLDFGPI